MRNGREHAVGLDDRGNTLEYVLVAVLVGLCALFAIGRFGGALRNKVGLAGSHVETIDSSSESKAASPNSGAAGGIRSGASVLAPEKMGELAAQTTSQEGVEVFGFTMSWTMAISLAALVVAIGVMMIMRASKLSASKEAKQVQP